MNRALHITQDELDRRLARSPYLAFLGVECRIEEDSLIATLPFADHLVGNTRLPALHGGAIGAFLETTAILELLSRRTDSSYPKTIGFTVQYLRSGKALPTYAEAAVSKHGRRVANVSVEAWQLERDRPIATGQGHFLVS